MEKTLAVSLVALVGVLLCGSGLSAAQARPAVGGTIVFTACDADEGQTSCVKTAGGSGIDETRSQTIPELFLQEPDGSTRQMTHNSLWELWPEFSPSGNGVAFSVADTISSDMSCRAYSMPVEGGDMVALTPENDWTCVSVQDWSPGGKWILLDVSWYEGPSNLFKVHPDGSGLEQITHFCDEDEGAWEGAWVHGARGVVYEGTDSRGGGARYVDGIYTIDADGDHDRLVKRGSVWDLEVAPDRRSVYYASDSRGRGHGELFHMGLDGSNLRQLTHNELDEDDLTFSPDGSKLLYAAGELYRSGGPTRAYVLDLESGRQEPLRVPEGAHLDFYSIDWVWSPDGTKVAFRAGDGHGRRQIYWTSVEDDGDGVLVPFRPSLTVQGWLP